MELIRKAVHYTQEGKSIFDQFYLDEDYNVPEQKEDVLRVVHADAELRTWVLQELLGEASRLFGEMAAVHAALEARYRRAMDDSDADRMTDRACALAERTLAG